MSSDLTEMLEEWPYEPGQVNVRVIEGDDGEPKVQMRLDLGILQMEATGRPDGQRPHNCESLLEYFESMLDSYATGERPPGVMDADDDSSGPGDEVSGPLGGDGPGFDQPADSAGDGTPGTPGSREPGETEFTLSPDDCRSLREEAVQYYHRYISLLVLGDYVGVLRDASRNMRLVNLCRDYGETDEDRELLEQFRPYLTMMRTRAVASQAIADGEAKAAVWAIDEGLEALRKVYTDAGREVEFETAGEVLLLRGMKDELMKKLPASQRSELLKRLQEAIERENYELAAILRDELRQLKE